MLAVASRVAQLAPHVTHKPSLAPLATALVEFLGKLPEVRGELLMKEEEVMLRAIARAQHEAADAEAAEMEAGAGEPIDQR